MSIEVPLSQEGKVASGLPVTGVKRAAQGVVHTLHRKSLWQGQRSNTDSASSGWNHTEAHYPRDACLHTLFEQQVAASPDSPAVEFQGQRLTYEELNARANALARKLQSAGVGPERLVGICMAPSLDLLAGLLGILKAGGAYVPMDPAYPTVRLAFMMKDTGMQTLVTDESDNARLRVEGIRKFVLPEAARSDGPDWPPDPASGATAENLAYVIYTSGSTGQPKGVMVTHRGLVNYLCWAVRAYHLDEGVGAPVQSSISFDLTVTSLFAPLLAGRCVTLLPTDPTLEALSLALRHQDKFSLIKITPASLELLRLQTRPGEPVPRAGAFIIGGEALSGADLEFWQQHCPDTALVNEYGPTETVVGCCVYFVPKGRSVEGPVPIGRPIANTQLYVLDPELRPVPDGARGELYIGGDGVARGYWNRPELTAKHFIANPFRAAGADSSAKLYRTGDLVRMRPDGNLEFLGRMDDQLKVSGFRIEPGEIEPVLAEHPGVRAAVVRAVPGPAGYNVLTAYCIPRQQPPPAAAELRAFLLNKLPVHLVPAAFSWMDNFPLTVNGKVDRDALPALAGAPPENAALAEPRNEIERRMVALWQKLFQRARLGIHDSFFELGGHSLLAVRLVTEINRAFDSHLEVVDLFQWPSIADLAPALTAHARLPHPQRLVHIGAGDEPPPVVFLNPPTELMHLARHLSKPQALWASEIGLPPEAMEASAQHQFSRLPSLHEIARPHVATICAEHFDGGVILAGFSYGGILAFEVASQLLRAGQAVRSVLLFDSCRPLATGEWLHQKALRHLRIARREGVGYLWRKAGSRARRTLGRSHPPPEPDAKTPAEPSDWSTKTAYPWDTYARVWEHAIRRHTWERLPCGGALFHAEDTIFGPDQNYDGALGWQGLFEGGLQVHNIPGGHFSMWNVPHVDHLCAAFLQALKRASG